MAISILAAVTARSPAPVQDALLRASNETSGDLGHIFDLSRSLVQLAGGGESTCTPASVRALAESILASALSIEQKMEACIDQAVEQLPGA